MLRMDENQYGRAIKFGIPENMISRMSIENNCWLWTAGLSKGYGQVWYKGTMMSAHRAIYHIVNDIFSSRKHQIDHICRIRSCVNPEHLEIVTAKENVRRSVPFWRPRTKTHCYRGHPYNAKNTAYFGNQGKKCRECKKIAERKYASKNKDKILAYKRTWKKKNYEKLKPKNREYYERNIERIKDYHRRRYLRLKGGEV